MERLNNQIAKGAHPKRAVLTLTSDELIKAALDEEEKTARENHKVYANVIKNGEASPDSEVRVARLTALVCTRAT